MLTQPLQLYWGESIKLKPSYLLKDLIIVSTENILSYQTNKSVFGSPFESTAQYKTKKQHAHTN